VSSRPNDGNAAAARFGNGFHDRQSETGAALIALGREEALEQVLVIRDRDARAQLRRGTFWSCGDALAYP
jgi:hypothetical protein